MRTYVIDNCGVRVCVGDINKAYGVRRAQTPTGIRGGLSSEPGLLLSNGGSLRKLEDGAWGSGRWMEGSALLRARAGGRAAWKS